MPKHGNSNRVTFTRLLLPCYHHPRIRSLYKEEASGEKPLIIKKKKPPCGWLSPAWRATKGEHRGERGDVMRGRRPRKGRQAVQGGEWAVRVEA